MAHTSAKFAKGAALFKEWLHQFSCKLPIFYILLFFCLSGRNLCLLKNIHFFSKVTLGVKNVIRGSGRFLTDDNNIFIHFFFLSFFLYIKLLLYLMINQLVWSLSIQDVILGVRSSLLNDKKKELFYVENTLLM